MIPQHITQQIEVEAKKSRRKYVEEELQFGTSADAAKWVGMGYKEGYEAGATAILTNPGEYGLAGRWRTPEEKMPPQNKRVLVEFKSGDCQMYELSVDANAIRAWWIRNVKRWLDESEPALSPDLEAEAETNRRYASQVEQLKAENERLRDSLQKIANWELPPSGKYWDLLETEPMSYEAAYGSNGVREYIKSIAANALKPKP